MHKNLLNKDCIMLCVGYALTALGAALYSAAQSYWVYEKTGSTALLGAVSSVTFGIQVIAGPVCGAIADHLKARGTLVWTDALKGAIYLLLGFLALNDRLSVWMIVVTGVMSGMISSLASPAFTSLGRDILDDSVVIRGQSVCTGIASILSLAGNALSGALIVAVGVPAMIMVNGALHIVSAAAEYLIHDFPAHRSSKTAKKGIVFSHLRESAVYLAGNKGLLMLFLAVIVGNLLVSGFFNLLIPYTAQNGMSTQQYGYLNGFCSAGTLIGTLALTVVRLDGEKAMKTAAWAFLLSSLAGAAGIYSGSFGVTAALLTAGMVLNAVANGALNGVLIMNLPGESMGALTGTMSAASVIGAFISNIVYGFLGEHVRLNLLGCIGYLLTAAVGLMFFHKDIQQLGGREETAEQTEPADIP